MLNIDSVNHVGIRVADKVRSISFYENLGFKTLQDARAFMTENGIDITGSFSFKNMSAIFVRGG